MKEDFKDKISSRKFLGFVIATILVALGKISDQVWLTVFITYCTANVAEKFINKGGDNQ
jgi:hypothetical protein